MTREGCFWWSSQEEELCSSAASREEDSWMEQSRMDSTEPLVSESKQASSGSRSEAALFPLMGWLHLQGWGGMVLSVPLLHLCSAQLLPSPPLLWSIRDAPWMDVVQGTRRLPVGAVAEALLIVSVLHLGGGVRLSQAVWSPPRAPEQSLTCKGRSVASFILYSTMRPNISVI